MTLGALAVIAAFIVVASLTATRWAQAPITLPMMAVLVGLAISFGDNQHVAITAGGEEVLLIAEVTLIILLFSDAGRISPMAVKETGSFPLRLLAIGLPLAAVAGTLVTMIIFPDLSLAEAGLVAAILTPTDAALGQAVVSSPAVPARIRHALEVESGLNDGLIVPVIGVFVAVVEGGALDSNGTIATEAITEIGLGIVIGALGGFAFGTLSRKALENGSTSVSHMRLATLAALGASAGLSIAVGGNGFIAAFVAGIALRSAAGEATDKWLSLPENLGQLGAVVAFVLFGATMVRPAFEALNSRTVLVAIVLLTVARMLPVAVAMAGSQAQRPTIAFIGWFGPRGLASMLFALVLSTEAELERGELLISIISFTVLASIFLHGMTATPLANRYGAWLDAHPQADLCENEAVPTQRPRPAQLAHSDDHLM